MTQVTVLAVGGTGESYPGDHRTAVSGLLRGVTDELDDRFTGRWVSYPASYGPVAEGGLSFAESTRIGVDALAAEIAAAFGPVALIGYSQGCTVVRELLGRIANGTSTGRDVIAAGLVSDPQQPAGVVPGCAGHGVAGSGPAVPDTIPVEWIAHPRDMICNASDDSFVRDIADITRAMSFRTASVWFRALWILLRSNSFQNATRTAFGPRQWRVDVRRAHTALVELLGYLPRTMLWRIRNPRGGRHTSYVNEPLDQHGYTGCQVLAHWLQVQITFAPAAVA